MEGKRRQWMCRAGGLVVAGILGKVEPVLATPQAVQRALAEFGGGVVPTPGRIELKLPEIAENGNSVPVSFAVESPMTAADYVAAVILLAEQNPNAVVATFHFSPASGLARASTRIRLARTQTVVAVARMNDGALYSSSQHVRVTVGGCGA